MQKKFKFGFLLLVVLLIINTMLGGFFIYLGQSIRVPRIDVQFDLEGITPESMTFTTQINMTNPNSFDLFLKDIEITAYTQQGDTIVHMSLPSSILSATGQKIITTTDTLMFNGKLSSTIYAVVQGKLGVKIGGIFEKTMPFQVNITASLHEILSSISPPSISISAQVFEISENGILFHSIVSIENPNTFEISVENLTTRIITENENPVGQISTLQGIIPPKTTSDFNLNGTLFFTALNAKIITILLTGNATVHVLGLTKSMALSCSAQLPIPDIKELLLFNESLDFSITLDVKIRLRGFLTTIGLEIYNPSKLQLQANDVVCSIFGLTAQNKKMISQKPMTPCTIESKQENCLETQVLIPYIKLITSGTKKILPDWFIIRIEGNFSIAGVNQSIPISIEANINPTLFR